jgi:hypothetical protein
MVLILRMERDLLFQQEEVVLIPLKLLEALPKHNNPTKHRNPYHVEEAPNDVRKSTLLCLKKMNVPPPRLSGS